MNTQRSKKKSGCLDVSRDHKLEELDFRWGRDTTLSDQWEAWFRELKELKEKHGHCNVPSKHPLGQWVAHQRYKKESRRLDAGRIQKLKELGFPPETKQIWSDQWETRLRELKEFKKKHGHCVIAPKHPGGLGRWVECLLSEKETQHRNEHRDAGRIKKLEELGFQWGLMETSCSWEMRFRELKDFKEEHGHCNVPQNYSGGLGIWVNRQCWHIRENSQRLDVGRI